MNQIQQQVAALSRKLDKLVLETSNTKPAKRRRRNRRKVNVTAPTPGTSGTVGSVAMRANAKRKRRSRGGGALGDGEIRLHRSEILATVKIAKGLSTGSDHVDLLPENFKFLRTIFNSFERIKFNKLNVAYRAAVGTTQGGMVTYAIDWTLGAPNKSRADLSCYTPNMSHPVWETPRPLVLPANRLMTRTWYMNAGDADAVDKGPGRLLWAADATATTSSDLVLGELWVDYDVILSGTKS